MLTEPVETQPKRGGRIIYIMLHYTSPAATQRHTNINVDTHIDKYACGYFVVAEERHHLALPHALSTNASLLTASEMLRILLYY